MAAIQFSHVNKSYADGQLAVADLSLEITDGEFLVLVGPSGCGKSTALRMIAGLEEISGGELTIGDRVANDLSPRERNVAMIFQGYALYPHLSVAENIGFALRMRKQPAAAVTASVGEVAAMLELQSLLSRRPGQLSGGQRQRVAMGRALIRRPAAFLMDEPLSNLDARLRGQMRIEIARLQRAAGATTVYVTHDQVEAMTMADRVAVMRGGVLQQLGKPRDLYDRPSNLFVAAFLGAPPLNLLPGTIRRGSNGLGLDLPGGRLNLPTSLSNTRPQLIPYVDREVIVGVRPEDVVLTQDVANVLRGVLVFQEDLGANVVTTVELQPLGDLAAPEQSLVDELGESDIPKVSRRVRVNAQRGAPGRVGEGVWVALDSQRLLYFDAATKLAIS
jgi:multiple sugar transport system ATP-binding protein